MGIKKYIQLITFLLLSLSSKAQQENTNLISSQPEVTTSESIYMHFNALTLITGETLFYKIYSINPADNKISKISKVAYVELLDFKKNSVFKHKLFLKDGTSQSDFIVQSNIKTGQYKIIAYTDWMQNKTSSKLFEQEIYIVNPFEIVPPANLKDTLQPEKNIVNNSISTNEIKKLSSKIIFNKEKYSHREEVKLNIGKEDLPHGNYSISVRKKDSLPTPEFINTEKFAKNLNKTSIDLNKGNFTLPEFRGEIISGKIKPNSIGSQIQNIPLSLSIAGKQFIFKTVRTNKNGEFFFIIDHPYSNPEFLVQIIGDRRNDFTILLNSKKNIDYSQIELPNILKVDSKLKKDLISRSIATQIENNYFNKNKDSLKETKQNHFYDPYSKEYKLDDYTRFPTLKQTIKEVVTEIHYSRKNGKYFFYLRDAITKKQSADPTITLIDGILVQDVSDLINYNAKDIEKIHLISKSYVYGGSIFGGIISIITKTGDFSTESFSGNFLKTKNDLIPEPQKSYFKQTYTDENKNSRIPDFRYQLLWQPEFNLSKNQNELSFFTSDNSGIYEISIEGFTENGKPISIKEYFEVK